MDKKKGLLNVIVSIAFKIVLLVGAILARRLLIKYIGNEVNGLNSLYASIIGFLAVAELGVGSAITFCMYKPIVEGDKNKVSALYHLFTKLYLIIGAIIFVVGCALIPLLPYLAADYQNINQNIYLTFFLMLVSVVITYLFSSKTSLINAYKNNYITTTISSTGQLLQFGMQILVLIYTRSFVWFLVCAIVTNMLQWAATELIARKKHKDIIKNRQSVDGETKKEVTKNIKAMFMHKIGGVLVNTADSVIISAFIGVVILGKYTNYTTIMTAMTGVLTLFFTPLTSVIGHMFVSEDGASVKKYLNFFHAFNFIIGLIFFLGYYAVIDNLVNICFKSNEELELSKSISFVITLNYFIQFMRQSTLLFRDATGTFYNDRWKPLFEGLLNVGLSIGFVFLFSYLFGEDFAVVGVIVATIITNLTICHIVEPHVLYKYGLKSKATGYYIRNYIYVAVFAALLVALNFCLQSYDNEWKELLVNGCIAVAISVIPSIAVILLNKDFRHYFSQLRWGERLTNKFRKSLYSRIYGKKIVKEYRGRIKNDGFSIICNNSFGGMLYNDLGKQPLSPTVNLYFTAEDYIEFLQNLQFYLTCEVADGGADSPASGGVVGVLNGKVKLYGIHYKTFDELRDKWNELRGQVNFDNLFIIGVYRDGFTDELVENFCNLPYKNKVFLSHKKVECENNRCVVKVGCGRNAKEVPGADKMASCRKRLYDKSFDFIGWLNGELN